MCRKLTQIIVLALLSGWGQGAHAQVEGFCALPEEPSTTLMLQSLAPAVKNFPTEGTVNALFIFVQHKNDVFEHCAELTGYDALGIPTTPGATYTADCVGRGSDSWQIGGFQSWTDNPVSEWPANLPAGPDPNHTRELPAWAGSLVDPPGTSSNFTPGSISDMYNSASNGKLTVTGEVWDYTYIPEHNDDWYYPNRGSFENGAVKLSHEIISYVSAHPYGIDFSSTIWDQYKNGEGTNLSPDEKFDMIVLIYRFSHLRTLAPPPIYGNSPGASAVTSLGTDSYVSTDDGFNGNLSLGGYDVTDNFISGSGVITQALTRNAALIVIAHEIGHRQWGYYHNDDYSDTTHDYHSIMINGPLSIGAGDRIKLGWANVQYIDHSQINGFQNFTLRDADVAHGTETDVLWIRNGTSSACGDVVLEARLHSKPWTNVPSTSNIDDGDAGDNYLPNEGLYIVKACGTTGSYSSIPNSGLDVRRIRWGSDAHNPNGMYRPGFGPGDQYSPMLRIPFGYHQSSTLDDNLAITDIQKTGNSLSFRVWRDYPDDTQNSKNLSSSYTFDGSENIAREADWIFEGELSLSDGLTIPTGSSVDILNGGELVVDGEVLLEGEFEAVLGAELTFNGGSGTSSQILVAQAPLIPVAATEDQEAKATNEASSTVSGEQVVKQYKLDSNYPNPFNPTTELRFELPTDADVSLIIYDALGREVRRLVDDRLPAGKHRVRWDATSMPSGVYFARMRANDFVATKQLVLVK